MTTTYFTSPEGRRLAYRASAPTHSPLTYVWLSGFKSDMSGTKVTELEAWATEAGHGFLAFDYSGHGLSDGAFEDGTISAWREDALAAIDTHSTGPIVLVGSSMGGWMALLAALARARYGDRYDAGSGVVRLLHPTPLRDDPTLSRRLSDPHVAFFARANPGWPALRTTPRHRRGHHRALHAL